MALQDLTPQLRTRLSRLERVVGLFVLVASVLLLAGLGFYIYQTAHRKGWFLRKLPYFTFARSAAGLKVGQPVKLMGLDVGEITDIQPQEPGSWYDMFIAFRVKEPYDGYLWEDSRARIGAADFLGNRTIEVTKGTNGPPTYLFRPYREVALSEVDALLGGGPVLLVDEIYDDTKKGVLAKPMQPLTPEVLQKILDARSVTTLRVIEGTNSTKLPTGIWNEREGRYDVFGWDRETRKGYFLTPDESPALTERLETEVNTVETALPNVLSLTNQLSRLLANAANAAGHADDVLTSAHPVVTNLNELTAQFTLIARHLSDPNGSLGQWLIPTNVSPQLTQTLFSANAVLTNANAQLTELARDLDQTIENLAQLTGNLHKQVDANPQLVRHIARLIIDVDDMVQGLKRHWLLRSAFRQPASEKSAPPPQRPRSQSPKDERK
jgi:ABC-type transporter Mla subunit MlaD